ncbi:MAG: hypothetical protein QOJ90_2601, partial [Actinomycetota bacterium]|nr:hypothetical protein [Actinomycetota bacterium]
MFEWIVMPEDGLPEDEPSQLATLPAGPDLALLLDYRAPRSLSGFDLIDYLGAARRLVSWAESMELHALSELARRRPPADGSAWVGDMHETPDGAPPSESDSGRSLHEMVSEFAADEV